jgi:hypothetical protein
MGSWVAQELQLQQNRLPWQRSMAQRVVADAAWLKRSEPLATGEAAVLHGHDCTIIDIDHEKKTCTIDCTAGGISGSRTVTALEASGQSACVQQPPCARPDATLRVRRRVQMLRLCLMQRARAAHQEVRRRHGVGLYEKAQALIVYSTYAALYALFIVQYPARKISFSIFKALRP